MKKKILILQLLGKSYGGIWQVNKLIGEEFIKNNYDVTILNLRDNKVDINVEYDKKINIETINKIDDWDYPLKSDVIKLKISIFDYLKRYKKYKNDCSNMGKYIKKYNPDYIIVSHYLLLYSIPKDFLKKTIYQQHSSAKFALNERGNKKTLLKFNNKIKFLWLSKASCDRAKKEGLNNCYYIYNAVRFNSEDKSDVINNKKIVTIARFSPEKRIDLMINMINEIFNNNNSLKDWTFEIYGSGELETEYKKMNYNNDRIKIMGVTNDPKKILLSSSINLNTSLYEGFCLSILEANECGVPTISFDFGESAKEQILNGKTGIIAENIEEYKKELIELMRNNDKLNRMSEECKKYSNNFKISEIIKEWFNLFQIIDKK